MNFGESYLDLKTYRCLLPILLYFCYGSDVAWCQEAIPRPYWSEPGYNMTRPPSFWPQSDRSVRSAKVAGKAKSSEGGNS